MPVVDASVVVDWVAPCTDPRGRASRYFATVVESGERLWAPRILAEEVANALLTGVRRSRWDGAAADVAFRQLRRLPITLADQPADLDRAWELSRRFDEHPVYDMLYVAVAEREGTTLVTVDGALLRKLGHLPYVLGL